MEQDTIAAISTAVSNSGIGIIRISGKDAVAVADGCIDPKAGKSDWRISRHIRFTMAIS